MFSRSSSITRVLKRRWLVTTCFSALAAAAVFGITQISVHPRVRSPHYLSLSVATAYSSLNQLGSAASSVAVLQATGTTSNAAAGGVPATVTQMTVKQSLAGVALPATVGLYQLGAPGVIGADVVQPNQLYIAYLTPYQNGNGPVAGQWTIVGGEQGLYAYQNADAPPTSTTTASGLPPAGSQVFAQDASSENPASPGLPTSISIAQAEASLGSASSTTTSTTTTTSPTTPTTPTTSSSTPAAGSSASG